MSEISPSEAPPVTTNFGHAAGAKAISGTTLKSRRNVMPLDSAVIPDMPLLYDAAVRALEYCEFFHLDCGLDCCPPAAVDSCEPMLSLEESRNAAFAGYRERKQKNLKTYTKSTETQRAGEQAGAEHGIAMLGRRVCVWIEALLGLLGVNETPEDTAMRSGHSSGVFLAGKIAKRRFGR
jgi:hypothetical protein